MASFAGNSRHPASSHPHPHHHDGQGHPHAHKPKRKRHPILYGMLVSAAIVAGAGLWFAFGSGSDNLTAEEKLVVHMQAATKGAVANSHVFGGRLEAVYGKGGLNVTAHNLPSKSCVSVAWRLAREGVVIVNGTMPLRISAAVLSELCAADPDGATLTWVPREN